MPAGVTFGTGEFAGYEGGTVTEAWTRGEIERAFRQSPPSIRKIQKALADWPGQPLTTADFATAMGPGNNPANVAGALGAYGRGVRSRYGKHTWPFSTVRNHEANAWEYTMPPDTAQVIHAL